jgi:hypothetical protein
MQCGLLKTSPYHVTASFSHTDSGPAVDTDYLKLLFDKATSAVTSCLEWLSPASIGWVVAHAQDHLTHANAAICQPRCNHEQPGLDFSNSPRDVTYSAVMGTGARHA